jgi:predicted ATPase
MINKMQIQGFKSWENTGEIALAPLTGYFGTNSSGKTALLQFLLMLKQTVESMDRSRVLHTGDKKTYVDLGTFYDIVYRHELPGEMQFAIDWSPMKTLRILDPESDKNRTLFRIQQIEFKAMITCDTQGVAVSRFTYTFDHQDQEIRFGMEQSTDDPETYKILADGYELKRTRGRPWPLPAPVKSYGFPDRINADYQNAGFLSEFVLAFEEMFNSIYYLGPLREYPERSYPWSGERPQAVGERGGSAIAALLAARQKGEKISRGRGRSRQTLEERVAQWLKDLGLIESFELKQVAENRKDYEVRVRRSKQAPEVFITDVGFGVSQVLPVIVLCYYAPKGSTVILEHPEIHLHPMVQAGLADVFIDAIKYRNIQIILESHSEHLLRRLQRRIAEEELDAQDAALYFVNTVRGTSKIEQLELDPFGNIRNWPPDFFGDEMEDLVAQAEAEMQRRKESGQAES